MVKKYVIEVTRSQHTSVEVVAENLDEALELAREDVINGGPEWYDYDDAYTYEVATAYYGYPCRKGDD